MRNMQQKHRPTTFAAKASALTLAVTMGTIMTSHAKVEKTTSTSDQKSVAVTIYNSNLALVKDSRTVQLDNGEQNLAFRGVSAQLRPETALLRNVNHPSSLSVIEQNFDFDLLTPQKLLEKFTGKMVRIATTNPATGKETIESAKILSTQKGTVVQIGDRIETNPYGRFIFDEVPKNLRDEPTLSIQLASKQKNAQDLELSYLTGGLSWKADYVAELNDKDDKLSLAGWVTLDNRSGASYNNATMQLVAGDVNQVQNGPEMAMMANKMSRGMMQADASSMSEESLFEYHLYSLNRPTTIANNQSKQVSLLNANAVEVSKELVLQGNNYYYRSSYGDIGQKLKLGVFVQFDNEKKNGLGMPLPKGVVRVYKRDSAGNAQFVGEDKIDHTPNKENVRLKLGDSFDVTANKKQTDFKINDRVMSRDVFDSSYEITIKNAKKDPVTVIVREPIPGDWKMLKESNSHTKLTSGTAEWRLKVPAEGAATLTYTTRVKY